MFFNPADDLPPAILAAVTHFESLMTDIENDLRQLGVYLDDQQIAVSEGPHGPVVGLMLAGRINRVAFSDRVLQPDVASIDDELRVMQVGLTTDEYLDKRNLIQQALAEGRNPFGGDDGT